MDKMTVKEVSEYMGVTRVAVYNWIKNGLTGETEKVMGVKPRLVFTKKDLMDFFQFDSLKQLEDLRKK